jgi:hypothetical protein
MAKFFLFLLSSSSIRYDLAAHESVSLISSSIDVQLGVTSTLTSLLSCGGSSIATLKSASISVGGASFASIHVDSRTIELAEHSRTDGKVLFTGLTMDEGVAMTQIVELSLSPDVLW